MVLGKQTANQRYRHQLSGSMTAIEESIEGFAGDCANLRG